VTGGPTGEDQVVPFSRRRAAIARRLTESAQTIPHFYLSVDADVTAALEWRGAYNEARGTHITVTDLVAKVTSLALRQYPRLNAHVSANSLTLKAGVHLGLAVATAEGLFVPVIADADRLSLPALSGRARHCVERARAGRLSAGPPGTFTLTSLGMYGVREFLPIINPPECAILAVGAAEPRVAPAPEGVVVRQMMALTLACDHRATDGAEAAQFLGLVKGDLQRIPDSLAEWLGQEEATG
jgi:pyruvate dehydrogenase E2 component (dihydrolipoamide acetyltransferase)